MNTPVVSRDPDVMGGKLVFANTRVPVQTLLDYLEAGESIDDFLAALQKGLKSNSLKRGIDLPSPVNNSAPAPWCRAQFRRSQRML